MRDLLALLVHFSTTLARLLGPGGTRAVIAETLVIKHQLVILNRSRRRAPNLTAADRIVVLENGAIRGEATPADLETDPEPLHRYVGVRR